MPKQEVIIELDVPEGWEVAGKPKLEYEITCGLPKQLLIASFTLRKVGLKGWAWLETLPKNALITYEGVHYYIQRNGFREIHIHRWGKSWTNEHDANSEFIASLSPSTCKILYPKDGE